MRNNPSWCSEDRALCEWTNCNSPRWAPYSWNYCAEHFAQNALDTDQERKNQDLPPVVRSWARTRFCGVLNGFTPDLGDVAWDTNYPREDLAYAAQEVLGLDLDETREAQWRMARAAEAARYTKNWSNSYRAVPQDHEGPGARRAISRSQAKKIISDQYSGGAGMVYSN